MERAKNIKNMERMRKIIMSDPAANKYHFELPENAIVSDAERLFMQSTEAKMPHGAILADPNSSRIFDKTERIGDLSEDIFYEIEFIVLPDTINA